MSTLGTHFKKKHNTRPVHGGIYAMYKGDDFLTMGTVEELAAYKHVRVGSIEFMLSPTYRKRTKAHYGGDMSKSKALVLVRVEAGC